MWNLFDYKFIFILKLINFKRELVKELNPENYGRLIGFEKDSKKFMVKG